MIIPESLKDYEQTFRKHSKTALFISYSDASSKPWESKIGGLPYLKTGEDWPVDEDGKKMLFLAQIDTKDIQGFFDSFSKNGLIQFFVKDDEDYGDYGKYVVRLTDNSEHIKFDMATKDYTEIKEKAIRFEEKEILPSPDSKFYADLSGKMSKEQQDAFFDICYETGSRIGGFPTFLQGPTNEYDEERDFLLLQLDSDAELNLNFGDDGSAFFFLPYDEAKKCDFSKTKFLWQSY